MKKTRLTFIILTIASASLCCTGCQPPNDTELVSIAVTKWPDKLSYFENEYFDTTGMVVTGYYSSGNNKEINNYTYSPSEPLTQNDNRINITFENKQTYVPIVVRQKQTKKLLSIAVTTPPTKTSYYVGELFNTSGMVVTASYDDNTTEIVTDYSYSPDGPLSLTDEYVTIGYNDKSAVVKITVSQTEERVMTGIEVTTPPTKTNYFVGDYFDKTGMVVKSVYSDGTGDVITDYTYSPIGQLKATDQYVVITKDTFTTRQPIVVTEKTATLTSIEVTTQPSKTSYYVGDDFNKNGMVVIAHYSDGNSKEISTYTITPSTNLQLTDTQITIQYGGKSTYVTITVSPRQEGGYYDGININSSTLLNDLNALNNRKRTKTVGYKNMLNNPEQGFYVTDPGTGSKTITTFYSGKSNNGTGGLNREHVWPNSRGGNQVEADIHMPRPTLEKENGSRGNSFYVEGKCKSSGGWDPAMESFGLESYRGDSARIIFYCAIASTTLKLVDKEDDSTGNKTMGKLSDLLRWNLNYPVLDREMVRNDGAESLQGNRNPFIDHPEYACKIWGTVNSETRKICGLN